MIVDGNVIQFLYMGVCSRIVHNRIQQEEIEDKKNEVSRGSSESSWRALLLVNKKLSKACNKYDKWKAKNQPSYKPSLYPEQMSEIRLNPADIGKFDAKETLIASADSGEGAIEENAVEMDDLVQDD
jgi:hypothetical protein